MESADVNKCDELNRGRTEEMNPENGTPRSRPKAQSCRDAAARAAIEAAVPLMIKMEVMVFVAA
jgi:hypothetical protein